MVFAAPMQVGQVTIPGAGCRDETIGEVYLPTGFGYAVPSNRYFEQPNPSTQLPDQYL